MGQRYIGHSYMGHNYIGHNYIGHNYIRRNYEGPLPCQVATAELSVATAAEAIDLFVKSHRVFVDMNVKRLLALL